MDATKALGAIQEILFNRQHDESCEGTKLWGIHNIVKLCNLPPKAACKQHGVEYCKLCHEA